MSTTSSNRNLIFIIAALLLTNIAVLVYFLLLRHPDHGHQGPPSRSSNGISEKLKDSVGFNEQQIAEYQKLKDEQSASIKTMFDEMRKAKESLFKLLSDPNVSDSAIGRASDDIANKQKALDLQTFNHFKKVRALCTPDQLVKYDSLIQRMFRKMGRPIHRGDKDRDDRK